MKLIKYFLQKRSVTLLLLLLIFFGGLFAYAKMGKLEDAPFTIKQALVLTPYSGASPSEVQSQVTDVLEEAIQSLGELYYLKTENRAGLSKITVYVKKEIRADEMQQLWDKLRRKVGDVQSKLPAGAGPSVVNDDFGDVLGVFYGLTGEGHTYRELEEQAKQIKNELLKTKDVAKIEIYGVQTPTIDIHISPWPGAELPRPTSPVLSKPRIRSSMLEGSKPDSTASASNRPETSTPWTISVISPLYHAQANTSGFRMLQKSKKAIRPLLPT